MSEFKETKAMDVFCVCKGEPGKMGEGLKTLSTGC